MAKRDEQGNMGSFARGAELWMQQARLFMVAVRTLLIISFVIGGSVAGFYYYKVVSPDEGYALRRNLYAQLREVAHMTASKMELHIDGKPMEFSVSQVIEMTEYDASEAVRHMRNGGLIGLLFSLGTMILITLAWYGYGKGKMSDKKLRGAELVDGKELKALMVKRDDCSPYELAGVPIRRKAETLHTLIGGAQGTGKSQQYFSLMKQVRARGKRAVIYDPTGEFTAAFYREGIDIILNPMDARSPHWTIWNEIDRDYHFDNMANGLIPDPPDVDPFWAKAGRMVLKDTYRVLGREGRRTNRDLYNAIAKSNLDSLHALLQGTAGATYVDPLTERTGMSLKMTVQNQLESFRFLHDSGEPFSIRKYVREESDKWLFITARESQREALKPVLSLWIDTAIKAVLDLKPIHQERLWFFLDELPTLQKLDVLKLALTNTRKYGLCVVIGVQDFSQLYEIYGHDLAKTIISGCQTKLLLRVTDGDAAKLLAKLMGEAEIDEKDETLSYGLNSQRDGVSVNARRQLRDIVLTSEILTLPDMHGYLATPADYPIGKVSYGYVPTPAITEGFIERDGFEIDFKPRSGAPGAAQASAPKPPPTLPAHDLLADEPDPDQMLHEVIFDEQGNVIDSSTGEVIGRQDGLSPAKVDRANNPQGGRDNQKDKPNPLADAL